MSGPLLIQFARVPRVGRVKTRLARDIGTVPACWWFRHQIRDLLRRLEDPRWQIVLAVAPDRALWTRDWPRHLPRIAQGAGDLGARMARILRSIPGPVCLIGGDIPGIRKAHIHDAFARLGQYEAVFGPTPDGGYWLVGLKGTRKPPPQLFASVRWSGPHALTDSTATLPDWNIGYAARLQDIDTATDLAAWRRQACRTTRA